METTAAVARQLGVSGRVLRKYAGLHLVTPGRLKKAGRPLAWSPKDVTEARWVTMLSRAGLSLQGIRQAREYLERLGYNPFSAGGLAIVRDKRGRVVDVVKVDGKNVFKVLAEKGQLLLFSLPEPGAEDRRPTDKTSPAA